MQALVALTHHFGTARAARGKGGIINVASNASFQPLPYMATYAATKAFVLHFSEAVHSHLGCPDCFLALSSPALPGWQRSRWVLMTDKPCGGTYSSVSLNSHHTGTMGRSREPSHPEHGDLPLSACRTQSGGIEPQCLGRRRLPAE